MQRCYRCFPQLFTRPPPSLPLLCLRVKEAFCPKPAITSRKCDRATWNWGRTSARWSVSGLTTSCSDRRYVHTSLHGFQAVMLIIQSCAAFSSQVGLEHGDVIVSSWAVTFSQVEDWKSKNQILRNLLRQHGIVGSSSSDPQWGTCRQRGQNMGQTSTWKTISYFIWLSVHEIIKYNPKCPI